MSKRSPEDILRDIEESDLEEAADKALAMTADQRHAELNDAGVDLGELHAKADAMHERMQRAATEQGVRRLEAEAREKALRPPLPRSRVLLMVAAIAVAAIVVALVVRARRESEHAPLAAPSASVTPTAIPGAPEPAPTPASSRDAAPSATDKPHLK